MLDVFIDLSRGEFALQASFRAGVGATAIFGRSGAGKSTLVAAIAGLVRPNAGRIALGDRVLFDSAHGIDLPVRRRRVAVVFQESRLFPHLSVRRNLLYGRWAGRRSGGSSFDDVVGLLGIEALLDRKPGRLSGGEAQRVAIGRALLSGPELLMMDEPLSHLDGARRAEILPFLERLATESGIPILYVSHAMDEVIRLADQLVILDKGMVAAAGPLEDVLNRIDLGAISGLAEAGSVLMTEVAGQVTDYALTRLALGEQELLVPEIAAATGERIRLRVLADDVAIALERPKALSIRNVLAAEVTEVAHGTGAHADVLLAIGPQRLRSRLTRQSVAELGLVAGKPVFALIKSVAIRRGGGES
ncbi:molybdate transport system ATP-binding protein [Faunimonas pinastri]|uniref:Molybdate transport system ATP-binding protein n=1 Tax=Faunimonas pinastri TaxID=1855383 RepID=A0A1H9NSN5_9HYPH|nr:molybdenum ABC transporter ATP-binding protein [Faunimonas pinastri]SER38695.1 molybdate transport system ATP-binding protein [Faunimonas pinastri]